MRRRPMPRQKEPEAAADAHQEAAAARDPVLAAFPGGGELAVVFEVSAIRHAPVVERIFSCMPDDVRRELGSIEEETGIDPFRDIDRVALVGGAVAISGFFDQLRLEGIEGLEPSPLGDRGALLQAEGPPYIALWNQELLLVSRKAGEVQDAVERLEGRLPHEEALPPSLAYGEIYGRVAPEGLATLLSDLPEVAALLREGIEDVEVHANVDETVGLILDVRGGSKADELMRVAKGALAAAKLGARELAANELDIPDPGALLELAAIRPSGPGAFSLELGIPQDLLERLIDEACAGLDAEAAKLQ